MTDPCLDAEVLAAWADNALDTRAAAQVEAHASRCARCQAMLAAFVRTGPPPAPAFTPAMSWWPSLQIRWLVPVAAVATALAIWVAVPTGPTPERERAGLAEPGQRPREAEAVTQAQVAPNVPDASSPLAKETTPAPREGAPASREEARDAGLKLERTDALASTAERRVAETPLAVAAPTATAAAEQGRRQAAFRALADSSVEGFVSRDGATRWRLGAATVERSTDGGTTWVAASLPGATSMSEAVSRGRAADARATASAAPAAPVGAVATASAVSGDAPSAAVCWLVGPRGAVWLTTDGGQGFRRLTVTGEPDLRTVAARDDRSADVTASDGRVFRTDDGGVTWTLIGP